MFGEQERVYYYGYWIKTYPVPADTLQAKRNLIEALTRRLFHHTEPGLNVPGSRLAAVRAAYEAETDPAKRRVKGGMLAGALFNRATDIFRRLVDLQADGVEIRSDYFLVRECGLCLQEALSLGRLVLHRSGDEGIDELWGEPFRLFSVPIEEFYESRYIKIGQCMRDIDRIAASMVANFAPIPVFAGIETPIHEFAHAARVKTETLRTDPEIFEVWSEFVAARERVAGFVATAHCPPSEPQGDARRPHAISDGLQLIRSGRNLIFYIVRARTPMPKSTKEYIERCEFYLQHGHAPAIPPALPD